MKRIAIFALVLLAACSSTTYPVTPPDVEIVQIYGPSNLDFSRGVSSIDAEYGIQIKNNATDPITLKHVTLESVAGTTIVLRREDRLGVRFNSSWPRRRCWPARPDLRGRGPARLVATQADG